MSNPKFYKMKNLIRFIGVLGVLIISGQINSLKAQNTNIIKEVNLNANDGFNELRKLVIENFDFTKPEFTEGEVDSVVKFQVAENGKISKVKVDGDCRYVSQELKDVLNGLVYKLERRGKPQEVYVLPVKVFIASR